MLALLCPEDTFLIVTHHLWLCQSSHWLLLQWSLSFGRKWVSEDVSFRADYHSHFFSAPGQLWISLLLSIWCRKKLLWRGLREALIYVCTKKLLEAGLTSPSSQVIVGTLFSWAYGLASHRLWNLVAELKFWDTFCKRLLFSTFGNVLPYVETVFPNREKWIKFL